MTALAHIGRGMAKKMITAVVNAGDGQRLVEEFVEAPGVLSISHHHARGVGQRRVRSGQLFFSEKDVLLVLVEAESADAVFTGIYASAGLGEQGTGLIFMENVLRGHPMMPLGEADW